MGLPMQAENLFWYITVSEECPNKKTSTLQLCTEACRHR